MTEQASRPPMLAIATAYVFAAAVGIWQATIFACVGPGWRHLVAFTILVVAAFSILLIRRPQLRRALPRFIIAAGIFPAAVLVRILADPFTPGIDYDGRPAGLDEYLTNVQLAWQGDVMLYGYLGAYFGPCSGLPREWTE